MKQGSVWGQQEQSYWTSEKGPSSSAHNPWKAKKYCYVLWECIRAKPLIGSIEGSDIAYTQKGWMNTDTFRKFLDHFVKFCGPGRPVVLLFDSVTSNIDSEIFLKAKSKGIELYSIVPNVAHSAALRYRCVCPLKTKWHLVHRKYIEVKFKEGFVEFYKVWDLPCVQHCDYQ